MTELNDKLKALLESQPIGGDLDIDAIAKQLGLDEKGKELLKQTWQNLDEINEKAEDLKKAKKEKGWSVKRWITNFLWKKTGNLKDEDKVRILEGIGEKVEDKLNEDYNTQVKEG